MNYLEAFYASLYDSRLKANQPAGPSPLSANIVLSLCLIVFIGSAVGTLALLFPGFGDGVEDLLRDIFGRQYGRTAGRLLVMIGLLVFFPLIRFTVGTPRNYQRIQAEFRVLPEAEQKIVSRRGAWFTGITLGAFVIPLVIWGLKSLLG